MAKNPVQALFGGLFGDDYYPYLLFLILILLILGSFNY